MLFMDTANLKDKIITRLKMGILRLEDLKPILAMILLQVIYAGVYIVSKLAIEDGLNKRVFVVYRQAIAVLVLVPAAWFSSRRHGSSSWSLTKISFCWIFLAAFAGVTSYQNLYFEGLSLASAAVASATANLTPAITFFISSCIGFEKVNFRSMRSNGKIVGTLVCITGAMTMALLRGSKLLNSSLPPHEVSLLVSLGAEDWVVGCLCLFACSLCWSIWLILQVPIANCQPNHLAATAWTCLFSLLQSAVVASVVDHDASAWVVKPNVELVACIYTGLFASGFAYFLQGWCVSVKGPVFVAMFSPLCTVIVTFIECAFLGEALYVGSLVGAVEVIIGLYIVLWGKAGDSRQGATQKVESRQNQDDIEDPLLVSSS